MTLDEILLLIIVVVLVFLTTVVVSAVNGIGALAGLLDQIRKTLDQLEANTDISDQLRRIENSLPESPKPQPPLVRTYRYGDGEK